MTNKSDKPDDVTPLTASDSVKRLYQGLCARDDLERQVIKAGKHLKAARFIEVAKQNLPKGDLMSLEWIGATRANTVKALVEAIERDPAKKDSVIEALRAAKN